MRFSKQDKATELIDLIRGEQRDLAALQKKFERVKQEWHAAQRVCSQLQAELAGFESTYTRATEPVFAEHRELLKAQYDAAVSTRDGILGDLPQQLRTLKHQTFRRLSILVGCLGSFISTVVNHHFSGGSASQCSLEVQEQLNAAHKQAEAMTNPADLIELIRQTVEHIEQEDLQLVPIVQLDKAVAAALAVGTATQTVA